MASNDYAGSTVFVSSAICFSIGLFVGGYIVNANWRHESVRFGHGEYSQKTGYWQWKAVEEPAPLTSTSELRAESGLRPIRR